jgi:proteasome accessory factor BC
MSRDEEKLIRQLSLLSFLLSRPRPFSAREVQESVEGYAEMSDETFARRFHADRGDLNKIGIEVRVLTGADLPDAGESQLYYLPEEDFRLPEVRFTDGEVRALAVALAALDGRFAYARPLRLALTALVGGQRRAMLSELDQLPLAIAADEDAQRAGQQLSRLEEAVTRGKTVRFSYPSGDGAGVERTLDPYSLFLIQGHWYVVGRDHLRDAIRTFRLGRIQGAVHFVTEKSRDFSSPADYDPKVYGARPPWLLGAVQGTATVRVDDDLAWWVKRLEPHVSFLGEDDCGSSRFAVPYADEAVFLSWVAGLGRSGDIIEPTRLRDRLRAALLLTAEAHDGPGRPSAGEGPDREKRRPSRKNPADSKAPVGAEHLARAMALLQYLVDDDRPPLVTWQSLVKDLGLSRAEVESDLSLINLINFGGGTYAVMAEARAAGVQVVREVMADTFAQPARLSPVMARALLLALDVIGDAFALKDLESLASLREKVRVLLGAGQPEGIVVVDEIQPPAPEIVEVINRAIRDRGVVVLEYFTASRQELGERTVEPYLLFHSSDGWYLEAFCLKAMDQRTFKLERIRSVRTTGETFAPRPEVDLTRRRTGQAFSPDESANWAIVRFAPRWRTYLEEDGIECVTLPEGGFEARVPYLDERWMAQHIVSYLGDAVLEHPASARTRIKELAAALAARQQGEPQG